MKFAFREFELDADRLELRRDGTVVEAQPKVVQVLLYLLRNADRTVTKRELLDGVWPDVATVESSLTRAVSVARGLVGKDVIENVRGTGYRIAVSVERIGAQPAAPRAESGVAGFVGRREERQTLDRWRVLAAESSVVALVRGDPGIGKTRLAREFTADARRAGSRVVWGSATEGAPRAYGIWRELLPALIGTAPVTDDVPRRAIEAIACVIEELRLARPDLERPAFAPPDSARPRFFAAIIDAIGWRASERPLVLVLDDVQWVDASSLRLLEEAIRETEELPVLWLLLARRSARIGQRELDVMLADWHPQLHVLELSGLDEATMASLAAQLGAEELSPERLVDLHERTDGNPLFVEQLVRVGLASPNLDAPSRSLERDALRDVTGAVKARLELLTDDCRRALEMAAVYGREVPIGLLADVLDVDELDLLDRLEPAERGGLITTEPDGSRFGFDHDLVRETLAGSLASGTRARCHKAIAEVLERVLPEAGPVVLPKLAWHLAQCVSRDTAKRAVGYALQAARHDMQALAFEGAVARYRDALRAGERAWVGDERDRAALWLELATALFYAGEPVEAEQAAWKAIALARRSGDTRTWANAAAAMSDWVLHRSGSIPEKRVAELEAVLRELGDGEHELRARVLIALSEDLHWSTEPGRAQRLAMEAVEAARRSLDPWMHCRSLAAAYHVLWGPRDAAERDVLVDEEVILAHETGDLERQCLAHHHRFAVRIERGDAAGAREDQVAADDVASRLRRVRFLHASLGRAANVATYEGRFEAAERHCDDADALRHHRSEDIGFLVGAAQRFTLARLRGRLESWTDIFRAGVASFPEVKGFAAALCVMSYEIGDVDRARAEMTALWADDQPALHADMQFILNLTHLAEVTATLGSEKWVRRAYEILRPCDGRMAVLESVTVAGSVSRVLGLLAERLGDASVAEKHFETALGTERRLGARPWEAYTARDLAAFLRRCGRENEAVVHDERARNLATELGMPQLLVSRPQLAGPTAD
jgi:DNA-binding winged helix-turn-helix (wHTH) protein/tetratricopeptide (TPR) repeat protein